MTDRVIPIAQWNTLPPNTQANLLAAGTGPDDGSAVPAPPVAAPVGQPAGPPQPGVVAAPPAPVVTVATGFAPEQVVPAPPPVAPAPPAPARAPNPPKTKADFVARCAELEAEVSMLKLDVAAGRGVTGHPAPQSDTDLVKVVRTCESLGLLVSLSVSPAE